MRFRKNNLSIGYEPPIQVPGLRCYDYKVAESQRPAQPRRPRTYILADLKHDLSKFITYLPHSEIARIVNTIFWITTEALRNYGQVYYDKFGEFYVTETNMSENFAHSFNEMMMPVPGAKPKHFTTLRNVRFRPSIYMKTLIAPLCKKYFWSIDNMYKRRISLARAIYNTFRHYRYGCLNLQEAFDKDFHYTGYSDEYIQAMDLGIIDRPGSEFSTCICSLGESWKED